MQIDHDLTHHDLTHHDLTHPNLADHDQVDNDIMRAQANSQTASQPQHQALLQGEVLIATRPHTMTGAAVTAQMYLPMVRSQIWDQLTDYSRWVQFFPDITQSQVLEQVLDAKSQSKKVTRRLRQVARKAFILFTAQVEIYLQVVETLHQCIQFRLERGTFSDFTADLVLEDFQQGTLLTYAVKATPLIPAPGFLIEEAIRQDLPGNMKTMRQILLG